MITWTGGAILLIALSIWFLRKHPLLILFTFFIPFSATAIANLASVTFSITPYHFFGGLLVATAFIGWLKRGVAEVQLDLACPFFWMATFIVFRRSC